MKKSKFSESQIVKILKEAEAGVSVQDLCRTHGISQSTFYKGRDNALAGMENSLRSRPRDEADQKEHEIKQLKQKIGDLVMDIEIYKEAMRGHPFGARR